MPDVNTLTTAELWEHANYYVGAVRTDDPSNLTHNAQMLANLVERLSEQVGHFRPATSKIPWDDEPADNPDSVNLAERVRSVLDADGRNVLDDHEPKPPAADPSVQALLTIGRIDKRNRLIVEQCSAIANQAEALGENRVHGPRLAAARRILSNAETLVAYIEAPGSGLELVKTWTYSQVNPGGADIAHGFTFTGTDDEWAEHLADLTYQGIEPFNAKEQQ